MSKKKKKLVDKKTEDQLLKELGFSQADRCDEPRVTKGILFIPVKNVMELPENCTVIDAGSDIVAAALLKGYGIPPEVVYRHNQEYYVKVAQKIENFSEEVLKNGKS